MPEPGREETVRVVALDKNFHMKCYKCEVSVPGGWGLGALFTGQAVSNACLQF